MKKQHHRKYKNNSIFFQYYFYDFFLMSTLAVLMAFIIFFLSAVTFNGRELKGRQHAAMRSVEYVEDQLKLQEQINARIKTSSLFQPVWLFADKYAEIQMLKNLPVFMYSVSKDSDVYIWYDGGEFLFSSEGKSVSPSAFFSEKIKIDPDKENLLNTRIQSVRDPTAIDLKGYGAPDNTLIVYMIQFRTSDNRILGAHIIYYLPKDMLVDCLNTTSSYDFVQNTLWIYDTPIDLGGSSTASAEEIEVETFESGSVTTVHEGVNATWIFALSDERKCALMGKTNVGYLTQSIAGYGKWFIMGLALCVVLLILLAYVSARRSMEPITNIVSHIVSKEGNNENELELIERTMIDFENARKIYENDTKEHLFLSIMRGTLNKPLIDRCIKAGINLTAPHLCVYIVEIPMADEAWLSQTAEEIDGFSGSNTKLYSEARPETKRIIVLGAFNYDVAESNMVENILSLRDADTFNVYMGCDVQTPEALTVSYNDAFAKMEMGEKLYDQSQSAYAQTTKVLEENRIQLISGSREGVEGKLNVLRRILEREDYYLPLYNYVKSTLVSDLISFYSQNHYQANVDSMAKLLIETEFSNFERAYLGFIPDIEDIQVKDRKDLMVSEILSYIDEHMPDPNLCLDELSTVYNMNPDYISRLIKERTGSGFKEYLTKLRIGKASEMLLTNQELNVETISQRVGYRSTSNFIKKFREITDMTPLQYRSK